MIDRVHKLIKHTTEPPESVVHLLENTLIGTKGTLYQLLDTHEKIHFLSQPHFYFLERNNKAVGNITICERLVTVNAEEVPSLYMRYFAFDQIFQGGGKGSSNSNFHNYFKAFFETSNRNPLNPELNATFYWAFIDPQNMRSFGMNERFGFETIGSFRTFAFSRLNPKKSAAVERLREIDKAETLEAIKEFYTGYNLFSDVHLFENDNYFVLKEEGEIIAGIQANPVHWKIKSLPGFKGKVLVNTLPFVPYLRKLINPNDHRFLATEGLFWKKGFENRIEEFLEGVLAESGHHSLLIWEDDNANRISNLRLKWGLINKIKENNPVNIVARFVNFPSAKIEALRNQPKYLSGFDMT